METKEDRSEKTKKTKHLGMYFMLLMSMLFFASSGTITGYSTLSQLYAQDSLFPLVMGFVALIGSFLIYFLMEK
ncbi:MAG: hypothetical protein AABX86_01375 [Nanoarchaeota archaeon]